MHYKRSIIDRFIDGIATRRISKRRNRLKIPGLSLMRNPNNIDKRSYLGANERRTERNGFEIDVHKSKK